MWTAVLFAFGAGFGVYADVVCNIMQLHADGILSGAEHAKDIQENAYRSIRDLCTTELKDRETDGFFTSRSGSTVFTITRTDNTQALDTETCEDQFEDIVDQCIGQQGVWGGTVLTEGLIYEVYNDDSPHADITLSDTALEERSLKAGLEARKKKKPKTIKTHKTKAKKPKAKKPKAKKPEAKKPEAKTPKAKKSKSKTAKKPKPKSSCPLPAKGKTIKAHGKTKGEKETAKKTVRNAELIGRADTQPPTECALAPENPQVIMSQRGGGWGTTWFGYVKQPHGARWNEKTILRYAKEAYESVMDRTERKGEVTLVAALWIRGDGIFFGSIPHGDRNHPSGHGQTQLHVFLQSTAPKLWRELRERELEESKDSNGKVIIPENKELYHAEDTAMFYYEELRRHDVQMEERFPPGTYMSAWGQRSKDETPRYQPPCSEFMRRNVIKPSCELVMRRLGIMMGGLS